MISSEAVEGSKGQNRTAQNRTLSTTVSVFVYLN